MPLFKELQENVRGQDYFVGDIHGHYDQLVSALKDCKFNVRRDRLFSVGDLIDRGPDSERCIGLLKQPWFHACLGNHEWMMIGGQLFYDTNDIAMQRANGGDWMDKHSSEELIAWAKFLMESCPLAIEVPRAGKRIGVTHNEVLKDDWLSMKSANRLQVDRCVWPRDRFEAALNQPDFVAPVANIDAVVSGHNSYYSVVRAANQLFIDTLWLGGSLTLLSFDEVFALLAAE